MKVKTREEMVKNIKKVMVKMLREEREKTAKMIN